MASAVAGDPTSLPIYRHHDAIVTAVRNHRAVVLEGPTGSGKTTQLPRMLLRAGLADGGLIGVTQPRRIAAVSVAHRVAFESGVTVGQEVGYAIRFDDRTSAATRLKIMTDGILLQEVRSDPDLSAYRVLIVDEAHERSLNIDFCLGLLFDLLKRRDELRVVVSSATLNPEIFQRFFERAVPEVPLVSVTSRTHPIDVAYRPVQRSGPDALVDAVAQHVVHTHRSPEPGHVLAFLTGEAMIARTAEAIRHRRPGPGLAVLPLYGRLPREEQERVFDDLDGQRKAVLATNIAETSITIDGVTTIIDTGLAKVPRFNAKSGMTSLREEPISRASAEQRAGRAGRTAPGKVIRLYSESDLLAQPEFTEEEIRRLDLSEVVLRLIDLGIRDVEGFHFPTPPPRRKLAAAVAALTSLGAIDTNRRLTHVGHRMVPFPLAPPLARMVVEAAAHFPRVLEDVLIVGSFLSGRPPYLFPLNEEMAARQAHSALAHPLGDAATAVRVFRGWQKARSQARFCQRNYLDPDIMAFIDKARAQLADIARDHDLEVRGGGPLEEVVHCVAAGFTDKLLRRKRGGEYETADGFRVSIHPGSSLYGARHPFLVAAEIVISTRPYARHASVVAPEWIVELSAETARRWRIKGRGRRAKKRVTTPPPTEVDVGGVPLSVSLRRGRPHVAVSLEQVERLRATESPEVDASAERWSARIVTPRGDFATGMKLGRLIRLLPHLPLPEPGGQLLADVPEGAMLTPNRNWPTLDRYLDQLLAPAQPAEGSKPGWLALVANGLGEFWLEVVRDFWSALQTTVISVEALLHELEQTDPRRAQVAALHEQLDRRLALVEAALGRGPAVQRPGGG